MMQSGGFCGNPGLIVGNLHIGNFYPSDLVVFSFNYSFNIIFIYLPRLKSSVSACLETGDLEIDKSGVY